MKAKILIRVERDAALEAIRTLDALGAALREHETRWPKQLKRRYKAARGNLVRAVGWCAERSGVADLAISD